MLTEQPTSPLIRQHQGNVLPSHPFRAVQLHPSRRVAEVDTPLRALPHSLGALYGRQVNTLIYSMGDETDDVLCSLTLSTEDLKKYDVVKGTGIRSRGAGGAVATPCFGKGPHNPPGSMIPINVVCLRMHQN